jgi:hypothetical protein
MSGSSYKAWWVRSLAWTAVLSQGAWLSAAEPARPAPEKPPKGEVVEMFAGMTGGQIDVQLIPKDAARGNLLITNKTDRPLSVKLPAAFAGVPVLAQIGGRQNGPFANPFMNPNATQQRPAQPGQQAQRVGAAPPFGPLMDIAPEKVGQRNIELLCLDHGKPNPRPAIKYQVKPIGEVTDKPGVAETCELLGSGKISHRAAQLAAWHFSDDMSWEKLAGLRYKVALVNKPTYTKAEIDAGKKAAEKALEMARQRKQPGSASQASASR